MKRKVLCLLVPLLMLSCSPVKNLYYDTGYVFNLYGDTYTLVDNEFNEVNSLKYAFECVISSYCYQKENKTAQKIFKQIKEIAIKNSVMLDSDNLYINKNKELVHNLGYFNKYLELNKPIKLEKETYDLIKIAYELTLISKGKFNLCIKDLSSLWDKYIKTKEQNINEEYILKLKNELPSFETIEDIFIFDDENYEITITHDRLLKISLNALAKGYFLENLKEFFSNESLLIDAGSSSISTYGNSFYKTWNINIRNPNYSSDELDEDTYLSLKKQGDFSLSVSGDYQNYYINNNIRYHHIIDPYTGYPSTLHRSSAIIGDNATFADGLSTILMMQSMEDNINLINEIRDKYHYDYNFILIDEDEKSITYYVDKALKEYVSLKKHEGYKISYF